MAWAGLRLPTLPTREALLAKRWTRPFARYLGAPVLWRLNRRSVARGLALGLFVGIVIPLVQSPFAALLSLGARANLPVAVGATFVTNPFTTPLVYIAAYQIGNLIITTEMNNPIVDMHETLTWLQQGLNWLAVASLPTAVGLLTMASVASLLGYAGTHLWWRWRVSRRWRARRNRIGRLA